MLLSYLIVAALFGLITSPPVVIFWFEVAYFVSLGWIPLAFISGLILARLKLKWSNPRNLAAIGAFSYCLGYGLVFMLCWINNEYESTRNWAGLSAVALGTLINPAYGILNLWLLVRLCISPRAASGQ
jgi:hypothetical protein